MNRHNPEQAKALAEKPETPLNLQICRLKDRFGISPDLAAIIAPLVFGEVVR